LSELRDLVLQLKEDHDETRKELDALKKRLKANGDRKIDRAAEEDDDDDDD